MNVKEQFLKTFFNEGESFCVSPDEYGYHSVSMEEYLSGKITLQSPSERVENKIIEPSSINLIAINPIKGFRKDENATAFRGFLVEMDDGPLKDQMEIMERYKLPYSVCIYSGGKSLHFGIVLEEELPNEAIWRDFAEWILNCIPEADQKTKNPSRSIRFPNNIRHDSGREQRLIENKGRVSLTELSAWLSRFPDKNPALIRQRKRKDLPTPTINGIPLWVAEKLANGIDRERGRNNQWFIIAMQIAKAGFSDDQMIEYLDPYFEPERDFSHREWKTIIKSAYKKAIKDE